MSVNLLSVNVAFCVSLITVMMLSKVANRYLSSTGAYALWLIIPITLVLSCVSGLPAELQVFQVSPTRLLIEVNKLSNDSMVSSGVWPAIYAVGIVSCLLMFLGAHQIMLHQAKLTSKCRQGFPWNASIRADKVKIKYSEVNHGPFTYGVLQPVLVLPKDFNQRFSRQQQRLVIEHELIHIRRRDSIVNLLSIGITCLFWFNPLAWFGLQRFRHYQELSCDQRVLASRSKQSRLAYAKAMLACISGKNGAFTLVSQYGEITNMKNRIQSLSSHSKVSYKQKGIVTATIVGVALMACAVNAGSSVKQNLTHVSPVKRVEPVYPSSAKKENMEGSVTVSFDIEETGGVSNISVVASEPQGLFDEATVTAVQQWVYNTNGDPQKDVKVKLDYVLSSDSQAQAVDTKSEVRLEQE